MKVHRINKVNGLQIQEDRKKGIHFMFKNENSCIILLYIIDIIQRKGQLIPLFYNQRY